MDTPDKKTPKCGACGGELAPVGEEKADRSRGQAGMSFTLCQVACRECGSRYTANVTRDSQTGAIEDVFMTAPLEEDQQRKNETRKEKLERLRRLNERVVQTEKDKKTAADDYGEQLKDLKAEIKQVLDELNGMPEEPGEPA